MLPKKSLGQNFLTSIPARLAIIKAGELSEKDMILEIGPGKGFLTRALLDTGAKVVALEKDRDLIPILQETFTKEIQEKRLSVIEGDALTFETSETLANDWKLIANIPYYITGAILSRYLSMNHQPKAMVVLVQKEVAERICAKDGKESILSLSVKAYGEPKLVYRVNKGSFNPVPKVDSAVLQIKNISKNNFLHQYHEELFFTLLHRGFAHKRKLLISNLSENWNREILEQLFIKLAIPAKARAEDITIATWLALSTELLSVNKKHS